MGKGQPANQNQRKKIWYKKNNNGNDKARIHKRNDAVKNNFKPLFDSRRLKLRWHFNSHIGPGLVNGLNTCFMNAVLQCLTYTPPLAQELLQENHRRKCRMQSFCAMCALETHMKRVFTSNRSGLQGASILPKYFTANLQALSRTLKLRRQEDAHEFLLFLFTALQKSSLQGLGKVPPRVEESTMLHGVFGGRLRSQVKCKRCNAKSNTFQALLDLSVDIQRVRTLEKALQNFINAETIRGYMCSACKQAVDAGKQMTVLQLPNSLIIHLKRFTFDWQSGYMRKVDHKVEYPEVLDMAPYVSPEKKKYHQEKGSLYRLHGVLVHHGRDCNSGHYYAFTRGVDKKWYLMDDESVMVSSQAQALRQNAYMLFYTRETREATQTARGEPHRKQGAQDNPPQKLLGKRKGPDKNESESTEPLFKKPSISKLQETNNQNQVENPKQQVVRDLDESKNPKVQNSSKTPGEHAKTRVQARPEREEEHKQDFIFFENGKDSRIVADRPESWFVRPSNVPYVSLRGNRSPPTYSAAMNDASAWLVREANLEREGNSP